MYPGMMHWWKRARDEAERRENMWAGCGSGAFAHGRHRHHGGRERDSESGTFGVRRPLRFLAFKLDLDNEQVEKLARILDELKTERAQAEVDDRRALSAFAAAVEGDTFDAAVAASGGAHRVASAERLRDAINAALEHIHALLNSEQRIRLAYLIRTGTLIL